jgi:phosphate starvation-inducible PhoH-like protein
MKIITVSLLFILATFGECFINLSCNKMTKKYMIAKNKESNLYIPKTDNQKKYDNILAQDSDYMLSVVGPPGTGKTLLACVKAIQKLKENKIDKIIITRPIVSVEDENLGFLPGNLEKKMDPWTRPIYDVFLDFYSKSEVNNMILNNKIEISPLGYMRGRTFKNSFILADEMQNSTPNQMLMLLTRIGINSKIVITGDLQQSDITHKNGLKDLIFRLKNRNIPSNFHLIEMDDLDIQRSNTVIDILKLYNDNIKVEEVKVENKKYELDLIKNVTDNVTDNKAIINKENNISGKKYYISNNDAALIPLKDISKFYKKLY